MPAPIDHRSVWSGHWGSVEVSAQAQLLRVSRWTVTCDAPTEPVPVVPDPADDRIRTSTWAMPHLLSGPPKVECNLEAFYHPDDNPFGRTYNGFPDTVYLRPGHVVAVRLYLNKTYSLNHHWFFRLLVSRIEQTTAVRAPQTFMVSGVAAGRVAYPTPS